MNAGQRYALARRALFVVVKEPLDVIAELETSWVTIQEFAPVPGYVCLVSRTHAIELHDLSQEVATGFMRDAQKVSKALSAATGRCEVEL